VYLDGDNNMCGRKGFETTFRMYYIVKSVIEDIEPGLVIPENLAA
jgi:hypothetical protein